MSTILRALRRLEEESASEETVGLHDRVVAPAKHPARRLVRAWMVVGAAGVAACLGAVVSWQMGPHLRAARTPTAATATPLPDPTPAVAAAPPVAAPAPKAVEAPTKPALPAPVPRREPRAAELRPAPEISSEVAVHDRGPAPGLLEAEVPEPAPEPPQATPRPLPAAVAIRQPQPIVRAPEPDVITDPKTLDLIAAAVVPPATEPEIDPVEVPASPGADVIVTQTTWHPHPERRSAIVEVEGSDGPRDLREGDRVGDLLLLKIKPSGAIFERNGVEVMHRVGKSNPS